MLLTPKSDYQLEFVQRQVAAKIFALLPGPGDSSRVVLKMVDDMLRGPRPAWTTIKPERRRKK